MSRPEVDDSVREELRATARRVLGDGCATSHVRSVAETPQGLDRSLWRTAADAGWLGLEIPGVHGGSGATFAEVALIAQEIGAALAPIPYLGTVVLGAGALLAAGTASQKARLLPELAAGRLIMTMAYGDRSGRYDTDAIGVTFTPTGPHVVADGIAAFVPDAHVADLMVLSGWQDQRLVTYLVPCDRPGVEVVVTPAIDRTRRLAEVHLASVRLSEDDMLRPEVPTEQFLLWLVERASIALAADSVGGARRVLELSTKYAAEREQFGRPIGSFQAVKHMCVAMLVSVESSQVAVDTSAAVQTSLPAAPSRWAAIAKSYCTDAYASVASDGVQVHGGIGFTWEHDLHLFLKRAKLNQAFFGEPSWHRERLAAILLDETTDGEECRDG